MTAARASKTKRPKSSSKDLIADEQVAVTVSHSGYMKRTPISTRMQRRGHGRTGMKTRDGGFRRASLHRVDARLRF